MRLSLLLLLLASPVWPADLEVELRNVRPRGGEVHAAVFDSARVFAAALEIRAAVSDSGELMAGVFTRDSDWPHPPLETQSLPSTARTLRMTFAGLEPGDYAVAAYQDRNGDDKLNATLGRTPLEPWGMSNNPRPPDRPPTWDEAKFTLPAEGARVVIELQ
jgi:uncharacterized protein (DUF2141 family)